MLVAEAIFLAVDRWVWHWNLDADPYRLIDLGVMVALFLGGLGLAAWFERDRRSRPEVFLAVGWSSRLWSLSLGDSDIAPTRRSSGERGRISRSRHCLNSEERARIGEAYPTAGIRSPINSSGVIDLPSE
jgi:hypothetical protein